VGDQHYALSDMQDGGKERKNKTACSSHLTANIPALY